MLLSREFPILIPHSEHEDPSDLYARSSSAEATSVGSKITGNASAGNPANHAESTDTITVPDVVTRIAAPASSTGTPPAPSTIGAANRNPDKPARSNGKNPAASRLTPENDTTDPRPADTAAPRPDTTLNSNDDGPDADPIRIDSFTAEPVTSYDTSTPGHTREYWACDPDTDGDTRAPPTGTNPTPAPEADSHDTTPPTPNRARHAFAFDRAPPGTSGSTSTPVSTGCHTPAASRKFTTSAATACVCVPSGFTKSVKRSPRPDTFAVNGSNFATDLAGGSVNAPPGNTGTIAVPGTAPEPDTPTPTGRSTSDNNPDNPSPTPDATTTPPPGNANAGTPGTTTNPAATTPATTTNTTPRRR